MIPVRQSTAFETAIGPVLDADGAAVTGCVVGDFKIKKTSGNFAALNGSATLTHVSAGVYDLVLTTSDVDTVGLNVIAIDDTVNACASLYLQVMEEVIYDALYAASANAFAGAAGSTTLGAGAVTAAVIATGAIDADAIAADAITDAKVASDVTIASVTGAVGSVTGAVGSVTGAVGSIASGGITEASFSTTAGSFAPLGIVDQGTAQSATGTTVVLRSAAAFANDTLIGCTIAVFGSTQGYWQERVITDNTLSDDTVTVDTWTVTPTGTITYKIFATPPAPVGGTLPGVDVKKVNAITVAGSGTTLDPWGP